MKPFFVITLVLFSCLCLVGVTQAVAVSKEGTQEEAFDPENILDSGKLIQTEEDKISEIRNQVLFLQESVAEITRSFSTLELVAKNPSMMAKIHIADSPETELELGEPEKIRRRRHVDSQSTSFSSSGAEQISLGQNQSGPYSWPMYSGQCFLCPAGVPGQRGPSGPQGVAGRDGRDRRDAPTDSQARETSTSPSDETNPTESGGSAVVPPASKDMAVMAHIVTPDYIQEMRKDGTWGGEPEIIACANKYRVNINVITSAEGSTEAGFIMHKYKATGEEANAELMTLYFGHVFEQHYVSLAYHFQRIAFSALS
ncbi:uncharacterized protein LOC115926416 [Strongylocentrotus purpuratus]|uniref:OTU domain-containing protein n=1 Tax=Strongylocentrotus purpuratus TaxID=7668 RepID=A0A7M7T1I7_STRPU|nr:uncharacterized protein LOC115926416 [Strongylocentrotus purpuratus]